MLSLYAKRVNSHSHSFVVRLRFEAWKYPLFTLFFVFMIFCSFMSYSFFSWRSIFYYPSFICLLIVSALFPLRLDLNKKVILCLCFGWYLSISFSVFLGHKSGFSGVIQPLLYPVILFLIVISGRSALSVFFRYQVFRLFLFLATVNLLVSVFSSIGILPFESLVYQSRSLPFLGYKAVQGPFFNVNYFFPAQVSLIFLGFVSLIMFKGALSKFWGRFVFLLIVLSLWGFSRGALLSLIVSGVIVLFVISSNKILLLLKIILSTTILTVVLLLFYGDQVQEIIKVVAFAMRLSEDRPDFLNNRGGLWAIGFDIVKRYPFGYGDGSSIAEYVGLQAGNDGPKSLENTYLFQAAAHGVSALLFYLSIFSFVLFVFISYIRKSVYRDTRYYIAIASFWFFVFFFISSMVRIMTLGGLGLTPLVAGLAVSFLLLKNQDFSRTKL